MCILIPMPLCEPHVESLTMNLIGHDVREYDEFQPFVEFLIETEWYCGLVNYCDKTKKDIKPYLDRAFIIGMREIGWNNLIAPLHIQKIDLMDKTDKYKIWNKCYNDYINNKLKTWN